VKVYKLISFWLDKEADEYGRYHRNICEIGMFSSKQLAEEYIEKSGFYFLEHWNNTCVIQEWDVDVPIEYQLIKRSYKQWFYLSEENPENEVPKLVDTPKRMKHNNERQTIVLGC